VGAFIVEDGDEVLTITAAGQVVRSPINADFRPTGRSTQGVKFVTPKKGDSVAVVARSVESPEEEDDAVEEGAEAGPDTGAGGAENSLPVEPDATIGESATADPAPEPAEEIDP